MYFRMPKSNNDMEHRDLLKFKYCACMQASPESPFSAVAPEWTSSTGILLPLHHKEVPGLPSSEAIWILDRATIFLGSLAPAALALPLEPAVYHTVFFFPALIGAQTGEWIRLVDRYVHPQRKSIRAHNHLNTEEKRTHPHLVWIPCLSSQNTTMGILHKLSILR